MNQVLLRLVWIYCLVACSEKKKTLPELGDIAIRKYYADKAFKDNTKDTIYELKVIDVDSVSRQYLINRQIDFAADMYDRYVSMYKSQADLARIKADQLSLYRMLGSKTLSDIQRRDVQEAIDKAKGYDEIMDHYKTIYDSLSNVKIDTTKKDYFLIKAFLKATVDQENLLDTFNFISTKEWKIFNPKLEVALPKN